MNKRIMALAAVGVVGLMTVTSACSGNANKSTGAGGSKSSAASGTFNAAATSIVNPSTKKGGTVHFLSTQDVDSLDPAVAYYAFAWNLQQLYTRTLVAYPMKPGAAGLALAPDLASAMPTVTNGGKTYTFTLKSGVKFDDGAPITSEDIKYGIERSFAQDVLPGGPTYLIADLDEGQHYPGPYKDKDPNKMGLKSVQTPNDSTIVFNLSQPNSDFLFHLAMGSASPVEPSKDTGAKYAQAPESSGPYKISSYVPQKSITFVRNPNWSAATDTIRQALPNGYTFTIDTNANDVDSQLMAGTADIDAGQRGVQTAAQAKILTNPTLKANTVFAPENTIRYISMQTKVAPFNNIHCREAVEYATSGTDQLTARGGQWAGALATSMLPPTTLGADKYDPYGLAAGKAQVDKAKQQLSLCGKPNGFSTVIAARSTSPKDVAQAVALQNSLKQVGITTTIYQYDGSKSSSIVGAPAVMHSKDIGLNIFGWGSDYPTASGFLGVLVNGDQILKDGNNNFSEVNDPQIQSLIKAANDTTDANVAASDYTKINHRVMDLALYFPGVVEQSLNYYNPRLTNVMFSEELGMINFAALGTSDGK